MGVVIYDLPGRDCAAKASNGELAVGELDRYKTEYIDSTSLSSSASSSPPVLTPLKPSSRSSPRTPTRPLPSSSSPTPCPTW